MPVSAGEASQARQVPQQSLHDRAVALVPNLHGHRQRPGVVTSAIRHTRAGDQLDVTVESTIMAFPSRQRVRWAMTRGEFRAGDEWALRPSTALGAPATRVEVLLLPKGRGGRCKIRHLEGELAGLEEFVANAHLRSRWSEWKRITRDEARELALIAATEANTRLAEVTVEAASLVLSATGEDLYFEGHRSYTRHLDPEALDRVSTRACLKEARWGSAPAYTDRRGRLAVPNTGLVDLAVAFAAAEPETVHLYLDNEEAEHLAGNFGYGADHRHLLRLKPAIAIARQWAGGAAEHKHVHNELARLKLLLYEALRALRAAGDERAASRIERKIDAR